MSKIDVVRKAMVEAMARQRQGKDSLSHLCFQL